MRISDWSSDVCSSDLRTSRMIFGFRFLISYISTFVTLQPGDVIVTGTPAGAGARRDPPVWLRLGDVVEIAAEGIGLLRNRSEEHTSELQSLMRISYAVFCLKKKKKEHKNEH